MKQSPILVTGGAGFIGSNLVDLLLAGGHDVRVIDNLSAGNLKNLEVARNSGDHFEFFEGDVRDFDFMKSACAGVRAIIHLAAQVSVQFSNEHPLQSAETNIAGFINVLDAARKSAVPRIIFASSAAVYGHPINLPLAEDSPLNPISPYGLEKLVNEQYASLYAEQHGLSCLGLRFFNVYGPRQDPSSSYAGVISKFFHKLKYDEPISIFGDGLQTRDFVYVRDVARICMQCLDVDAQGILAVGTGRSVTINQLLQAIANTTGRAAKLNHIESARGDIRHSALDPSRLLRIAGIPAPTVLEVGLENLWSWMLANETKE
jgi:UDP-glucose 4-epimerase